jgi:hypothetical protein
VDDPPLVGRREAGCDLLSAADRRTERERSPISLSVNSVDRRRMCRPDRGGLRFPA